MPELPEVEMARRRLSRWCQRDDVVRVEVDKSRVARGSPLQAFKRLRGRVGPVRRHGKQLALAFEKGGTLLSHLGMTGKWVVRPVGVPVAHSRARLVLRSGKAVHYVDPRMFGLLEVASAAQVEAAFARLGPDLLLEPVTGKTLKARLADTARPLKVALLDQARVAGLGNIHATEALFRSRLAPTRVARSLSESEWARLARGIRDALKYALALDDAHGDVEYLEEGRLKNPFLVYGRNGLPCRRCRRPIRSFTQAGRTTYECPFCQR